MANFVKNLEKWHFSPLFHSGSVVRACVMGTLTSGGSSDGEKSLCRN